MENTDNSQLSKKERRALKRQAKLERQANQHKSQTTRRALVWTSALGVVALVIIGLVKFGGGQPSTNTPSAPGGTPAPVTESDWTSGNKNATTTLIEYSDFECPACAAAEPTVRALREEFGERALFVYRQFPLMGHPVSRPAAAAAEAAGKQGKFWEMHDYLFSGQKAWSGNTRGAEETFKRYATELKLDINKFTEDMNSSEVKNKVQASVNEGMRAGVNSTPSFYLNGKKLDLQKFSDLTDAVRAAVQK